MLDVPAGQTEHVWFSSKYSPSGLVTCSHGFGNEKESLGFCTAGGRGPKEDLLPDPKSQGKAPVGFRAGKGQPETIRKAPNPALQQTFWHACLVPSFFLCIRDRELQLNLKSTCFAGRSAILQYTFRVNQVQPRGLTPNTLKPKS